MTDLIEYKVRPVTRYVVTKFERNGDIQGSSQCGTFDNHETAYAVGYALAKADHERMGWPVGDERIQYPNPTVSAPYVPATVEALRAMSAYEFVQYINHAFKYRGLPGRTKDGNIEDVFVCVPGSGPQPDFELNGTKLKLLHTCLAQHIK